MLTAMAVSAHLKVQVGAVPPALPQDVAEIVESLWLAEVAKRGDSLFNGPIFSVDAVGRDFIKGWRSEYKFFLAQRRNPDLYQSLRIRPLAVTGLLLCDEGALIGRRSDSVEQDAGMWEFVPSGGVEGIEDSISLPAQAVKELREETGIESGDLSEQPMPFALVEDTASHVCDVGLRFRTGLNSNEIAAIFARLDNREYVELRVMPVARLVDADLAPASRTLLELAKSSLILP